MSMGHQLGWIFPHKFYHDDRQPVLTFEIPSGIISDSAEEFGFFLPSILFWVETLRGVFFMIGVVGIMAIPMYLFVVQQHNNNNHHVTKMSRQTTTLPFLVGLGVILPFWLTFPAMLVKIFDLQNKLQIFCMGGILPTLSIFRTTEAVFDCVPQYASKSLKSYVFYSLNPMTLRLDPNKKMSFVPANLDHVLHYLQKFLWHWILLGALQSFLDITSLHPFGSTDEGPLFDLSRCWNPRQIGDNIFYALIFQGYLTLYSEGLIAATIVLTSYECEPMMLNPLMESISPSDFWAHRWNMVVHGVLKRGVYIPLRKMGWGRLVSVIGAFLASGLFHEWLLTTVFAVADYQLTRHSPDGNSNKAECLLPTCMSTIQFGGSTAFMLWCAGLIVIEYMVGHWFIFQWIAKNLPRPLISMIVVLLALPIAHWFVELYIHSDFFNHGGIGLPMVKRISS